MGELVKGLGDHVGAILILSVSMISMLVAVITWFAKRTINKIEENLEKMLETVIKHDRMLERIRTAHKHIHKEDLN